MTGLQKLGIVIGLSLGAWAVFAVASAFLWGIL